MFLTNGRAVSGRSPYIEAMLNYGRAHPDCHDQVMIRLHYPADDDALYAAADACGPYASLMVKAEDLVSDLSVDDSLDAFVEGSLQYFASSDEVVGEPTTANVESPYNGRVLRWRVIDDGAPPTAYTLFAFASNGRLWQLTFTSLAAATQEEATIEAIASSFRVTQRESSA